MISGGQGNAGMSYRFIPSQFKPWIRL